VILPGVGGRPAPTRLGSPTTPFRAWDQADQPLTSPTGYGPRLGEAACALGGSRVRLGGRDSAGRPPEVGELHGWRTASRRTCCPGALFLPVSGRVSTGVQPVP